jgi:hypothetical protein
MFAIMAGCDLNRSNLPVIMQAWRGPKILRQAKGS